MLGSWQNAREDEYCRVVLVAKIVIFPINSTIHENLYTSLQKVPFTRVTSPVLTSNKRDKICVGEPSLHSLQEVYHNSINPLVEEVPHIFTGLHLGLSHFYRPQIFRGLWREPHLFPCSSIPWTTVFCIGLTTCNPTKINDNIEAARL